MTADGDRDYNLAAGGLMMPMAIDYAAEALGSPHRPLRDFIIGTVSAERGPISYDPNHPSNVEARRRREEQNAAVLATYQPPYEALRAATDGVARRLVDLHSPVLSLTRIDNPPGCAHCEHDDDYGVRYGAWPCATARMIAAEVGVELPAGDDES